MKSRFLATVPRLVLILTLFPTANSLAGLPATAPESQTPVTADSGTTAKDQANLQGLWAQPCTNGSVRTETFDNKNVSLKEMFFTDKDCRVPAVVFRNDGTYELPRIGHMDFKFTTIQLRLLTEVAVQDFNRRKVCDFENWKLGEEKDITGRSCEMFLIGFPQRIPTAGEMRYGIYHINQDLTELALGKLSKEKNATTPDKRPEELDSRIYRKVPRLRPIPDDQ